MVKVSSGRSEFMAGAVRAGNRNTEKAPSKHSASIRDGNWHIPAFADKNSKSYYIPYDQKLTRDK